MLSITDLLSNFNVKGETEKPVKVWRLTQSTKSITIHTYTEKQQRFSWDKQPSCTCTMRETFNKYESYPVFLLQMKKRKSYGNHWIDVTWINAEEVPEEYQDDVNAMIYKLQSKSDDMKNFTFYPTKEEAEAEAKKKTLEAIEKEIDKKTGEIADREEQIRNLKGIVKGYTAYFDKFKL